MAFDPDTFLDAATVDEPMATEREKPDDGWYIGEVKQDGIKVREIERDGKDDLHLMEVTWVIDDDEAREKTGSDSPSARQTIFLDVDEDGKLETGANKNLQLGRLRDAVEQNDPNQRWTPRMLEGARAYIMVKNEPRRNDPETVDTNIKYVRALR